MKEGAPKNKQPKDGPEDSGRRLFLKRTTTAFGAGIGIGAVGMEKWLSEENKATYPTEHSLTPEDIGLENKGNTWLQNKIESLHNAALHAIEKEDAAGIQSYLNFIDKLQRECLVRVSEVKRIQDEALNDRGALQNEINDIELLLANQKLLAVEAIASTLSKHKGVVEAYRLEKGENKNDSVNLQEDRG